MSYTQTSALHNPNVVKVLLAAGGRGLYFSRSALPHVRDVDPAQWCAHTSFRGHVGIYAYRADVLLRWHQLPISPLENLEKLEQLWLIEAGIRIDTPYHAPAAVGHQVHLKRARLYILPAVVDAKPLKLGSAISRCRALHKRNMPNESKKY